MATQPTTDDDCALDMTVTLNPEAVITQIACLSSNWFDDSGEEIGGTTVGLGVIGGT